MVLCKRAHTCICVSVQLTIGRLTFVIPWTEAPPCIYVEIDKECGKIVKLVKLGESDRGVYSSVDVIFSYRLNTFLIKIRKNEN